MNQHHEHKHSDSHGHDHGHGHHKAGWKPHRDWRVWVAVVLMLAAISAYVLTMDESIVPGAGRAAPPVPANAP